MRSDLVKEAKGQQVGVTFGKRALSLEGLENGSYVCVCMCACVCLCVCACGGNEGAWGHLLFRQNLKGIPMMTAL